MQMVCSSENFQFSTSIENYLYTNIGHQESYETAIFGQLIVSQLFELSSQCLPISGKPQIKQQKQKKSAYIIFQWVQNNS